MRKGIYLIFTLVILSAAPAAWAEEIVIVGTGSGVAILQTIGKAFTASNPDVTITIPPSIGSGGGIKAVGRDEYQLGRVARQLNEKDAHFGLTYVPIAKMPIVFFTNKNIEIGNLSVQQVLDIYSGKIVNWKDVGGKDAAIKVVRREDGDSSLSALQESFPGFKDITITDRSKTVFSDPETLDLVEQKEDTIAFGAYGDAAGRGVNIVKIDTISPTDAGYACFGTLALIFKENNKKGNIAKFIEFTTSAQAHESIKSAGGIPF
jgi:phosphate transport system substrate-binding protein